jgi:sec-independent protein translocase protein TatA
MFNVGPWELILILVVVLIIFGPGKLPQMGESIGKALNSFKKAQHEDDEEMQAKQ